MKLLIVKMSSMGDVVHGLALVTELKKQVPDATIDWVVEEGFADVPRRHPGVSKVIPVAIRRWRRNWLRAIFGGDVGSFVSRLRDEAYDYVIDSQGLIKSALVASMAKGPRTGFDSASAREPLSTFGHVLAVSVPKALHAVERQRRLGAGLFGYTVEGSPDYGLPTLPAGEKTLMLIHGTSWPSKHWPEASWRRLREIAEADGWRVVLPAGSDEERARAERITAGSDAVVLPPMPLADVMDELARCEAAIGVDTGLTHIATAFNIPLVSLYGPTDPGLTGTTGPRQESIASDHLPCIPCGQRTCRYPVPADSSKIHPPCFDQLAPEAVWQALQQQRNKPKSHRD